MPGHEFIEWYLNSPFPTLVNIGVFFLTSIALVSPALVRRLAQRTERQFQELRPHYDPDGLKELAGSCLTRLLFSFATYLLSTILAGLSLTVLFLAAAVYAFHHPITQYELIDSSIVNILAILSLLFLISTIMFMISFTGQIEQSRVIKLIWAIFIPFTFLSIHLGMYLYFPVSVLTIHIPRYWFEAIKWVHKHGWQRACFFLAATIFISQSALELAVAAW